MKMDRKALGGFYELMLAMMIACIAISSFLGVVAYEKAYSETNVSIRTDFLNDVEIINGEITGITEYDIEVECQTNGFHSMVVTIDVAGNHNNCSLKIGNVSEGRDYVFTDGNMKIPCDDGTSVMATYEVVAFV